jgi:hypothetical protein
MHPNLHPRPRQPSPNLDQPTMVSNPRTTCLYKPTIQRIPATRSLQKGSKTAENAPTMMRTVTGKPIAVAQLRSPLAPSDLPEMHGLGDAEYPHSSFHQPAIFPLIHLAMFRSQLPLHLGFHLLIQTTQWQHMHSCRRCCPRWQACSHHHRPHYRMVSCQPLIIRHNV